MANTNKTRAEQLMEQRHALPPEASPRMVRSVSQFRRENLEDEFTRGEYREMGEYARWPEFRRNDEVSPIYRKREDASGLTAVGRVSSSGKGLRKMAQQALSAGPVGSTSAGAAWRGPGDSVRQVPEVYSPLWLNSNLNLPRDRATINAWSRSFFALNPIVHNAITLHSTYPIAKLNIKCHNRKVEKFFADMAEEIDLMNVCVQIAQEFWTLGEAFIYAELDERTARWSRLLIQNPDYITVKRSVIAGEPIISLRPDENLRRIVFSNRPVDVQQRRQLDPRIIEHVKRGENIPLNNFYVSHLARKISPYEIRGTGLIVSSFRQLMLFDKLRESKFAQADNMVNPLTLVKIGSEEFHPTPTDLDAWRQVFEESQYDKDFKIFTHKDVVVERVGYGQGIYDISGDITQLIKEIWIGLMVPSVIMDGSDTTYATGSVSLDVLRQRYMQFRNMLGTWLKRKIFAPISKLNDFYEYVEGDKVLVVPEVDWNHMSLFDMSDYIQNLSQLAQGDGPAKKVSLQTLFRSLGLDYDDEARKIRYEDVQDAIRRKELVSLDRYSLNDLRALGPSDEINEIEESPVPGESPYETPEAGAGGGGMPGAPGGLGGGGGGLGGLPPIPSGPPPSPVGRPPGIAPQPPGGGTGIGPGGVPKPPAPG
jgi:hypothetical protein